MSVIRNINGLDADKQKSLSKLLITYFNSESLTSRKNNITCRIKDYLRIKKHVENILTSIQLGKMTGYASFDFDFANDTVSEQATGFIMGYGQNVDDINFISNYYVGTTESYPRLVVLKDLFEEYTKDIKKNGAKRVRIASSIRNFQLMDDLKDLEFGQIEDRAYEIEYGRRI